MFCNNCGKKLMEGDLFCGNCGKSLGNAQTFVQATQLNDFVMVKFIKTYFRKPVSFFSELRNEDLLRTSVALIIGLPIIYGILNILYTSSLISAIFNLIKKLPELLAKVGVITPKDAVSAQQEFLMSKDFLNFKDKLNSFIDNKDVFFNGAGQVLALIVLTGIILATLNATILKGKIKYSDVLFISASSYIPLVLSLIVSSLATFISIIFGLLILISGYILSFITLYCGIKQLSGEKNDKVFILMTISFLLISAALSIFIIKEFESSIMSISNAFKSIESFI
jgi:hypothetical protein